MLSAAMAATIPEGGGTLVPFPRTGQADLLPFEDNLDHLKALELEATLLLAVTWQRRHGEAGGEGDAVPSFPPLCRGKSLAELQELSGGVAAENRRREELSPREGGELLFPALCATWRLDRFERSVLMILLMMDVAPDFASLFDACGLGAGKRGMKVGTLLAIICDNLRDQLACRCYFSVEAALVRNDLIVLLGDPDDTATILDEKICIQERLVRHILGDNNLYSSCFRYVKREKSSVSLDQVILPGREKDELVHCMARYLDGRSAGRQEMDEFYGSGTALVYLFHGPSGTGKTMMARALAARFDRPIFSLTAEDMREMPGSYQEIIATLFREAGLQHGIVFFDECDDVFEAGCRASRALLIELEKARCVVILATNRPVELDPALERRISVKSYFALPEADVRRRIWEALIPPSVTLADNVDLDEFAGRYRFTGGLIRNSIFLALTAAGGTGGVPVTLTAEELHYAAGKQTATLADERRLCRIELPTEPLAGMPLERAQLQRLRNLATVWERLRRRGTGLALVITASDTASAVRAARGVARECGLVVRSYDLTQILSRNPEERIADPVTQRKIHPLEYAFSPAAGDEAMTLFIDHEEMLGRMLSGKREQLADLYLADLLAKLREHTGLFCIVGKDGGEYRLPPELSVHERLRVPERDVQEAHWRTLLPGIGPAEGGALRGIVAGHPLHLTEIDFIVRQASILATVRRLAEEPSLGEVAEVLERFRGSAGTPLLFGGECRRDRS